MAGETGGLCTTRCQLFRNEITKTENALRMKWFVKNRQRLLDNLRDPKLIRKAQQIRQKYEEKQHEDPEICEKPTSLPSWRLPKSDGSVNLDVMKPVDSNVRAILYEAGVESYVTGHNYLHERYKEKPEDRFYFPDCTSWLHGWRLKDYPSGSGPKFGRNSIIRDTFYRLNGASVKQRSDDDRECQTSNAKGFDDLLTY